MIDISSYHGEAHVPPVSSSGRCSGMRGNLKSDSRNNVLVSTVFSILIRDVSEGEYLYSD